MLDHLVIVLSHGFVFVIATFRQETYAERSVSCSILGRAKNGLASYAMLVFVCEFLRGSAIELGACV